MSFVLRSPGAVVAQANDGSEEEVDVVIGADGLRSSVRIAGDFDGSDGVLQHMGIGTPV